jgi:hypothetical protein
MATPRFVILAMAFLFVLFTLGGRSAYGYGDIICPGVTVTFWTSGGTIVANGVSYGNGATATFKCGVMVPIRANPNSGYSFTQW